MSKLIEFEDTQAAIFLLRLSFGIVRANHFMRPLRCPFGQSKRRSLIRWLVRLCFSVWPSNQPPLLAVDFKSRLRICCADAACTQQEPRPGTRGINSLPFRREPNNLL